MKSILRGLALEPLASPEPHPARHHPKRPAWPKILKRSIPHSLAARHRFDAERAAHGLCPHSAQSARFTTDQAASNALQRSWDRLPQRFLNDAVSKALRFWQENAARWRARKRLTGVQEEIIVAIIGVETEYGRNMGGFGVWEDMATLAFNYPPRAEFFRSELRTISLLSRENQLAPLSIKGSYAGCHRHSAIHAWQPAALCGGF